MNNRTTDDGVGGLRGRGITPTQPSMFHARYPDVTDNQVTRRAEFKDLFAALVRSVADGAISKEEKSVCAEAIKGRSLSVKGLEILLTIAARSQRPFAVEEFCRQQVLQRASAAPSRPFSAFEDETRAQASADVSQWQFVRERLPVRRDQALDHMTQHSHQLRRAIDALHVWTPNGRIFA